MIFFAERKVAGGEFGGEFSIFKPEFVEASFVAENGDIVIETFDVGEIPGVKEEITVAEGILETVGGETRDVIVGDGEEFVIGDFARENAVFFELTGDDAGVADDFASARFDRLLMFGVAIEVIDSVLETGAGDVVEETSEGLDFVVGEVPDDESDADAMGKDRAEILEIVDGAVIHGGHADVFETLELRSGDVFEKPSWKSGGEDFEIFTQGRGERAQSAIFTSSEIDGFFARAGEKAGFGRLSRFGGLNLGDRLGRDFCFGWVADGWGGLGRAIDFNKILFKPKTDFLKTALGFIGHLEKINFGLVVMIEIVGNDMLEFGIGAGADIAGDIVAIFIHDKENVGTVEIFPEAFVGAEETFGIGTVA